jgi:hypothetical protein
VDLPLTRGAATGAAFALGVHQARRAVRRLMLFDAWASAERGCVLCMRGVLFFQVVLLGGDVLPSARRAPRPRVLDDDRRGRPLAHARARELERGGRRSASPCCRRSGSLREVHRRGG